MSGGLGTRVRKTYRRTHRFFGRHIWEQPLEELSSRQRRLYRFARIVQRTLRSLLLDDTLHVRSAALTYFSVLALVPLLALAFVLLRRLGGYDVLIEETVRPHARELLQGNPALHQAFEQILAFVQDTDVTSLGFVGLVTLLYASTRLLRNIEGALNEIWDVRTARQLWRQLRDYLAIMLVTPLCLMAAAALTAAGQALDFLQTAQDALGVGGLLDRLATVVGPLVVVFVGLLVLYRVMPNTRVRVRSSALGALIGALLWYLVLIAHVRFQIGVANFNALYSSFGAIPLFLAWLHLSWLMVMIGAQVAATHQNSRSLAERARMARADATTKESFALAALLTIARACAADQPPRTLEQIGSELAISESLLAELLEPLSRAGLVVSGAGDADRDAFTLARSAERIRVQDVRNALRTQSTRSADDPVQRTDAESDARALLSALDRAAAQASENRSLHEILRDAR